MSKDTITKESAVCLASARMNRGWPFTRLAYVFASLLPKCNSGFISSLLSLFPGLSQERPYFLIGRLDHRTMKRSGHREIGPSARASETLEKSKLTLLPLAAAAIS